MKKKMWSTVMLTLLIVCCTACGANSSSIATSNEDLSPSPSSTGDSSNEVPTETLKLAHVSNPDSPEGRANQYFADLVYEKSGGNIEVLVYPSEQLGKPVTTYEGASMGTIDIAIVGCPDLGGLNPYFSACNIPYLYTNQSQYQEILEGEVGESQLKTLDDSGLILLSRERNYFRGPYRVLASKKPIKTPEDLQGVRFRTFDNKVYMTAYETLGANPIVISWSEVYMGLVQGTIDAASCNAADLYTSGITEIAKYVAVTEEYFSETIWLMNRAKFESMPTEYQQILYDSYAEAAEFFQKEQRIQVDEEREKMVSEGVEIYEFTDADRAVFQAKLKDLYYTVESEGNLPKGTVDKIFSMNQ